MFLSSKMVTSNVKYLFRFLIIMTRYGNFTPKVPLPGGHEMKLVETFEPVTSRTVDWISASVMRLIWPLFTFVSQIWRGFDLELVRSLWHKAISVPDRVKN